MTTQPDALSAHLRRLSTDTLAALVTDVWAARGYQTERHENTVAARNDRTIRIQVSGADDRAPTGASSADILVRPRGADSGGTRVIDADDLAELIRYGVSVNQRDDICERYLGAPPPALEVPWQSRARERLRGSARPALAVVGLLLCVLVAVSVFGVPDLEAGGGTGEPAAPSGIASSTDLNGATDTAGGQSQVGQTGNRAGSTLPLGVGLGGIEDISQLDKAHGRAIGNRSYTMRVDLYWPRSGRPGAERVHRNMDFSVGADGRYLVETTVRTVANNVTGTGQPDVRVYHDGQGWYVAERTEEGVEYRQVPGFQQPPVAVPEPTVLRDRLAAWYLSTPEMNVSAVSGKARPAYRLVGHGQPLGASRGIANYTVQAFVRSDGLIKNLTTHSTRQVTPPVNQQFDIHYDRFNATAVTTPEWVLREFDVTRS
jgi:hypothetical protein